LVTVIEKGETDSYAFKGALAGGIVVLVRYGAQQIIY
jgi:hypothetical protein